MRGSGERAHGAGGDLADRAVATVGDVDREPRAAARRRHTARPGEAGCGIRTVGEALHTRPRKRADRAGGRDRTNHMIFRVGDIDIACGVDGHTRGRIEARGRPRRVHIARLAVEASQR